MAVQRKKRPLPPGILCPSCGKGRTFHRVVDSRTVIMGTRRWKQCGCRFTTMERIKAPAPTDYQI